MASLKSKFITPYVTLLGIATVHTAYQLIEVVPGNKAWLGAGLAVWPAALFFTRVFLANVARTSENFYGMIVLAAVGALMTVYSAATEDVPGVGFALAYSVGVGFIGLLLYNFWYSRFDRGTNEHLQVGAMLPEFSLEDTAGSTVLSSSFQGKPSLFIFYRGNWCPLCMAQIKEVAGMYKEMADRGVNVILVSPQSHENSESLAKKFDVPFQFLVDKDNQAAKQLDLLSIGGTPGGLEVLGYDTDTVLPTVLITDASGQLIFADLTDNYRVRPEPETFIRILDEHKILPA